MTGGVFNDPADTREEILAATYRSLREHGYADLTMKKIGSELEQSPSLIYHHYENKDALVIACLEYLLEHFEDELHQDNIDDPTGRLEGLLEWWFPENRNDEWWAFMTTIFELRSQAVHDSAYREHFTRSDRLFKKTIATIIRAGIETGEFRECDPDAVAESIRATILGTVLQYSSTTDSDWFSAVHDELKVYLRARVYAETGKHADK